jgi:hypothetical protein
MEAIRSSETILTRATNLRIPKDGFLHSHPFEHLKSYIALTGWTLKQRCNVFPVKYELVLYIPETEFFFIIAVEI